MIKIVFILLMLILSLTVYSAESHLAKTSFIQLIDECYQNNSEIKSAKARWQSLDYSAKSTRSAFLPTIKAQASYSYLDPELISTKAYSTSLIATQNLFSGFADWNKFQLAKLQTDNASISYEKTLAKISSDLKTAYASLLYAQNLIQLLEDVLKRRNDNLKLVELRFESGRENKGSLLLSKAYLARSELELMQAKNALGYFRHDLNRVLGRDQDQSLILAEEDLTPKNLMLSNEWTQHSLNYKISLNELEQSKTQLSLSKSAFSPQLSLSATESKTGSTLSSGNNQFTLGLTLTLPLFNGGNDFYNYKYATENVQSKHFSNENTYRELVVQIEQAYSSVLESKKKIEVDSLFVEAAKVRSKIAKEQYNNGLISFTDWDLVENDYINYQKTLLLSKKEAAINTANFENLIGEGVFHEK